MSCSLRHSLIVVFCISTTLAMAAPGTAAARQFYVAPDGNDTNPGTKAAPFATLHRARTAVRKAKADGALPDGPITVWIREGTYRISETFGLAREDSGNADARVVYSGYPDERARLIGGRLIPPDAFTQPTDAAALARLPDEAEGDVLMVDLNALGITQFGPEWPERFRGYAGWPEVFFNGQPMQLARWPNDGYAHIAKVIDRGSRPRHGEKPDRPGKFTYEGDRPQRWLTAPQVYLNGYWCFKWYDECIKVGKIDPDEKTITMAAPHHYGIGGRSGGYYYALGLLEELDQPGEYYVDRENGILYFWPPEPLEDAEVAVSLLSDDMVRIDGASNVTLRNVTLDVSRGVAVRVDAGRAIRIENCTIRDLANHAIVVNGGEDHAVTGCEIYQMGRGGIRLQGGDRTTLTHCNHEAVNNHIHHFGRLVKTYQPAIALSGVGCDAAYNLIHHAPHQGMSFSGNEHVIELNEFHNVCLDTDDAGAIYTGRDWTQRGNIIRHNFFHDIPGGPSVSNQAVYLDDLYCGTVVFGNVIYNVPRAMLIGGGRDNIIENNVIVNCPRSIRIDNRGMGWAKPNPGSTVMQRLKTVPYKKEPWRTEYPHLPDIIDDDPGVPKYNVVRYNVLYKSGKLSISAPAREHGAIADNLDLEEDPGFVDAQNTNFTLKKDSVVFDRLPDFRPTLFREMGLVEYPLRGARAGDLPVAD